MQLSFLIFVFVVFFVVVVFDSGHSLGGGIAQIVGANLYEDDFESYVSSFGSNSPGTKFSSAKLGYTTESLRITSTSVVTDRDLVSAIDEHSGLIQEINCDANNVLECHLTETPICQMLAGCPSNVPRNLDYLNCYCYEEENDFKFGYCMNLTAVED